MMVQAADQHHWEFPAKLEGEEYGYFEKGELRGSTRLGLISRCRESDFWGESTAFLVWTPDTLGLVAPEQVPFLFEALRERRRRGAFHTLFVCGPIVLLSLIFLSASSLDRRQLIAIFIFWLLPLTLGMLSSVWELWRIRTLKPWDLTASVETVRFAAWLQAYKTTYTKDIAACLVVVGLIQAFVGGKESVAAAGIVKEAVRAGEIWRLLTGTMLHVNFNHFWMNGITLLGLGRLVERATHRACVPLVFLLSALSGSLFSLYLMPQTTSVGASGGLMGLIGWAAVVGFRRKESVPPGFLKRMLMSIALIGAIGIVGYELIDNAAHFGGLVCGAMLGLVLIGKHHASPLLLPYHYLRHIGVISLFLIAAGAGAAILAMSAGQWWVLLIAAITGCGVWFGKRHPYFDKY